MQKHLSDKCLILKLLITNNPTDTDIQQPLPTNDKPTGDNWGFYEFFSTRQPDSVFVHFSIRLHDNQANRKGIVILNIL